MKTAFFSFLGVLAAGLILFALYIGWQHFDRWQQSRNYCVAEIEAISERSLLSGDEKKLRENCTSAPDEQK